MICDRDTAGAFAFITLCLPVPGKCKRIRWRIGSYSMHSLTLTFADLFAPQINTFSWSLPAPAFAKSLLVASILSTPPDFLLSRRKLLVPVVESIVAGELHHCCKVVNPANSVLKHKEGLQATHCFLPGHLQAPLAGSGAAVGFRSLVCTCVIIQPVIKTP